MFSLKSFALFLVILCSIQFQYGNGTIQKSQGSERFNEGFLFVGKKSFDQGNLVFAVCDKNTTSMTKCNVVQKVYPNKDAAHNCLITLQGDHDESDLDVSMGISTLGKDKVILYWGEDYNNSSSTKIGTVDLQTCKMNVFKIPDPKRVHLMELYLTDKLVTHNDDSFDIFINDEYEFGDNLGKLEVNGDGTPKGEPVISNIKTSEMVYYLSPIATRSSSKGYAALRKNDTDFDLLLIKPDGSEKQLEKYTKTARPTYSASENVLSTCNKENADSDVTCKQYDEDGNIKFITSITDTNKNIRPTTLYNLPGGGMLVLLAELKPCEQESNCKNDSSRDSKYRMVKINGDGKIKGTARIEDFDSVSSKYKTTYVYKYSDSEYCAALIGDNPTTDEQMPSDIEIIHDCVTEDEFKV